MQRKGCAIGLALLVALVFVAPAAAQLKVGVVDLQKAMEMSAEGRAAKAQFEQAMERVQRDLKTKQDELNRLKEELERQGGMLNPSARYDKEKVYQDKLRDFKRLYEDYQEDMRRQDAELSEKILRKLVEIVERFGQENGYDLILEKTQSAVLYKSAKIDVTDAVIQVMDKEK